MTGARRARPFALLLLLASSASAELVADAAIECDACKQWNAPRAPFRVFGNTYYVGTAGLSAILIDGGEGLLLLDGGLPQSAPLIEANLEKLGFRIDDVEIVGLSHAHFDHAGGIAAIQRASGARVVASRRAAAVLENGALDNDDPQFGIAISGFPPVSAVEIVADGAKVRVGNVELTAIYTPGHTTGGTSWTWQSCEADRCLRIVYADSLSAVSRDGYRFSTGAGERIRSSADTIAGLECDVFLSPHPFYFDLDAKLAGGGDAFIDGSECRDYAGQAIERLQRRLESEAAD